MATLKGLMPSPEAGKQPAFADYWSTARLRLTEQKHIDLFDKERQQLLKKLARKVVIAAVIQAVCLVLLIGPLGWFIIHFSQEMAGQSSETQGWLGLEAVYVMATRGPFLIPPLIGFFIARARRISLSREFDALEQVKISREHPNNSPK